MSERGEVLVAIINNKRDFAVVRRQGWYRIPVSSMHKWLQDRWPPHWLAFYQTKEFGQERYSVRYYAPVLRINKASRRDLFPSEPENDKSSRIYYQLWLGDLHERPLPILSRRWRRIVFIPTTWDKFNTAVEINDLYDESPLEDRLWAELKRHKIPAERQEFLTVQEENYALDFAIYCDQANIDVETDGDTWHANPEKAAADNLRDNALEAAGWKVLRFSTPQIHEGAASYCIPTIRQTINKLGGVEEGKLVARRIDPDVEGAVQLGLFDDW
jgi:very-short-patch-repair endonuclease